MPLNGMLAEEWMVTAILMKASIKIRNMLLQTIKKSQPCDKVAKILAELFFCSSILWEVELVSDEIGCLAEKISMQTVVWNGLTSHTVHSIM